jgi:hypothetical protein
MAPSLVMFVLLRVRTVICQTQILLGKLFWLESFMPKFNNKLTFNLHKVKVSFSRTFPPPSINTTCPLWTSWSSPPGCGRSITDFWGWDVHETQLLYPDEVDGDGEYEVPGGALNLSSTELPRRWSPWGSSPSRKNPHDRTWNRTRVSWSVFRNSDH